jgi:hypothetical protein
MILFAISTGDPAAAFDKAPQTKHLLDRQLLKQAQQAPPEMVPSGQAPSKKKNKKQGHRERVAPPTDQAPEHFYVPPGWFEGAPRERVPHPAVEGAPRERVPH